MRRHTLIALAVVLPGGGLAAPESYRVDGMPVELGRRANEVPVHGHLPADPGRPPFDDVHTLYEHHLRRGKEHLTQGRVRAAIEDLTRAAGLEPWQPYVRRLLGWALAVWGDYRGASAQFRRMLRSSDRPLHLCIRWERDYPVEGISYGLVLDRLRAVVRLRHGDPDYLFCLAWLRSFESVDGRTEAKKLLHELLAHNPADDDATQALRVLERPRFYIGP